MKINLYLILFIVFAVTITFVLLMYTPWGQRHLKWLNHIVTYLFIGLILGVCLVTVSYLLGHQMAIIYTPDFDLP